MFKKEAYAKTSTFRMIGSVCAGVLLSSALLGVLFKIQFYPGASAMLHSSVIGFTILMMVLIIFSIKGRTGFINDNYLRIAPILIACFVFYSISNVDLAEFYFGDSQPEYIEALRNLQENPNDPNAHIRLDKARDEMHLKMNPNYNRR